MSLKFSIILPTYNRASMISKSIDSVLSQVFNDWELIIVDDGSTDETKDKVQKYQKLDKRIKYIFQNNSERSVARNNGITQAKNDWICFLDSDDIYHPTHLMRYYDLIKEKKNKKGLYFSGVSINKYDNTLQEYNTNVQSNLEFVLLNTIGTPRACCSKEILIANQFNTKIQIGEDKELWCRITRTWPIFYHSDKTFIEIEHDLRSINKDFGFKHLETLKLIVNDNKIRKHVKNKIFSNAYFNIGKSHIIKNKYIKAAFYIFRSILKDLNDEKNKHKALLIAAIFFLYKRDLINEYKEKNISH